MNCYIYQRFSLSLLLIICCTLLVGCSMASPETRENSLNSTPTNGTSTNGIEESVTSAATVIAMPTTLATIQETATLTPEITADETQQPAVVATITPTPTAPLFPSPTHTPEPSPTVMAVECENNEALPLKVSPTEIDMRSGRIAVDGSYLYLAVQQYIGVFDISSPESPEFLGFWEIPDLSSISAIEAKQGVVYAGSDSTLQALNASPQCQFETIFQEEMPLQIYRLGREDDRLYVGGASEDDGKRQVIIFSINELPYQELGTVDLGEESATWSVLEEILYSLSGNLLTFTDVSNPTILQTQIVNLELDPEAVLFSPGAFSGDTLYLLLQERGGHKLTIVSDLMASTPTIIQDPLGYGFGTSDVFRVQGNYIFVGNNSCDVSCASVVTITDIHDGKQLSRFGLQPHYPVYHYREIRKDLIYAFSNDSLLVINVSNVASPEIINQVPFMP